MNAESGLAVVLLLGCAAGPALAGDPRFFDGQREFREGVAARNDAAAARTHFGYAADGYGGAINLQGYDTPGMWRMRGNASLLAGNVPIAVFDYRQGLELDPDDAGLRRGLELARSRVQFVSPEERAALTPRPEAWDWLRWPLRRWGLIAIAAGSVFAWVALGYWVVTRRPRWLTVAGLSVVVTLLVTAGWLLDRSVRHAHARQFAVLMQTATLRRGDGPAYLPRRDAPLPAGTELRVRGDRGDWVQVELADGTVGWLPNTIFIYRSYVPKIPRFFVP